MSPRAAIALLLWLAPAIPGAAQPATYPCADARGVASEHRHPCVAPARPHEQLPGELLDPQWRAAAGVVGMHKGVRGIAIACEAWQAPNLPEILAARDSWEQRHERLLAHAHATTDSRTVNPTLRAQLDEDEALWARLDPSGAQRDKICAGLPERLRSPAMDPHRRVPEATELLLGNDAAPAALPPGP